MQTLLEIANERGIELDEFVEVRVIETGDGNTTRITAPYGEPLALWIDLLDDGSEIAIVRSPAWVWWVRKDGSMREIWVD